MAATSEKALRADAPWPDLPADTLRLYSSRTCPFAQRTRLTLAYKNIPHEKVNVHLRSKPDWFLQRNPNGTVPILEKNGQVVYESSICCDYLDDLYPDKPLYDKDPYKRARQKILKELFGKVVSSAGGFYAGMTEDETQEAIKKIQDSLRAFEDELNGDYFGGDSLSIVDIYIWPWFERFDALRQQRGLNLLESFPKLQAWVERMFQHPAVKATTLPPHIHDNFMKTYAAKQPDYDIGL